MGKIIIGLIGAVLGAAMTIKSEWLLQMFGRIPWAEAHLGIEGGTRMLWKLIGIVLILISFMVMTGLGGEMVMGVVGPMFGVES